MAVTEEEALARFVESEAYQQHLRWHVENGCKLAELDTAMALRLAMRAVAAAGCTVAQMAEALARQPVVFDHFVTLKLAALAGDQEEDYPPGEEPPAEERPKVLSFVGYPATFLVGHLAEFTVLTNHPDDFEAYARRYRLPGAKKYAKHMLRLFKQAQAAARSP
jgi:hypothetical protein